ncbi:MAG: DNA-binding response regulator [Bacteroidetes bacterium]|nr:MAG: DNA-binding response regulator [Bacteroidota bacterium]
MISTKLYIIEDHRLLRETWIQFLESKTDLEIVGEADNITDAFKEIERLKPHILMLDINLKGESGITLIQEIKKTMPFIKIIVVSMHDEYAFVKKMFSMGVQGYVSKNAKITNLFDAINSIKSNHTYLSDDIKKTFLDYAISNKSEPVLTYKETQVISFICQGFSNKQISNKMSLSIKTIEGYKTNIYKKLNLHSTAELIKYAGQKGIF